MIHIDFETRSRVNLLTDGVYNYAQDPSTSVICMCWAFDDDPIQKVGLWREGQHFPAEVTNYIAQGGMIAAHNAAFERLIFTHTLPLQLRGELASSYAIPALEQFYCTATQARANALPGQLGDLARCLGLAQLKQQRGHSLIRLLSIPQEDGTFNRDPDLLGEMYDYCAQDVRTEREAHSKMRPLTPAELEDYWASERVNDRGLMVDIPLCEAAVEYAEVEGEAMRKRIEQLTKGAVTKVRGEKLKAWVMDRLTGDQWDALKIVADNEQGFRYTLDKNARARLLEDHELPPDVREVVECSDAVAKSSVSKFDNAWHRADCVDDRVRGAYVTFGAGQTHRFSARGLQLHNFPREGHKDPERVRTMLIEGWSTGVIEEMLELPLMTTLARMLRPMLIPKTGHEFVVGDWSAIEARGLPWLSADERAEGVLDAFRAGEDIYVREADNMGIDDRQIGKVAVLSLGYGGAVGAFQNMAKNYGVKLEDMAVRGIVAAWRQANRWAVDFWRACEQAAVRAMRHPGEPFEAGRLQYLHTPEMLGGVLWCLLPNGRLLAYPGARLEYNEKFENHYVTCIKASLKPKAGEDSWPRMNLWGGLLVENATQAVCGGILRDCMLAVNDECEWLVGHTHDELILEVPAPEVDQTMTYLKSEMEYVPDWAEGLPLDAELWHGNRYRK